jgi:hypothetical protein
METYANSSGLIKSNLGKKIISLLFGKVDSDILTAHSQTLKSDQTFISIEGPCFKMHSLLGGVIVPQCLLEENIWKWIKKINCKK